MKKDTNIQTYNTPLHISFRGTVFGRCQHCSTLRRYSDLLAIPVVVGKGCRVTDGVKVPKEGGRIRYEAPKRMFFRRYVKMWLCSTCRVNPDIPKGQW